MSPTKSVRLLSRLLPLALLAVAVLLSFPTNAFALFNNGGFENGDLTGGWTPTSFLNYGLQGSAPFTGGDIVHSSGGLNLTNVLGPYTAMSQTDANTGGVLHYPLAGSYCAVVNFQGKNENGNSLTQTAAASANDVQADGKVHVEFGWAAVVQNPAHADVDQPFVYVAARDLTKGTLLYESFIFAGSGAIWHNAPNTVQYTNWQVIDIAPGAGVLDVGDQVQIEVTAAGCSLGGHWGYVYVDHFGSFRPVTAQPTVADKTYDGTSAATLTGGTLTGVQSGDNVSLNLTGATATFDSPTPGTGVPVTVSGMALGGTDSDKYMLMSNTATTTADIVTAAAVAVTAAANDLQPGDTTTVTATATDSSGNPVSGQTITFSTPSGSVGPVTAVTDANGQATTTFTAGATLGSNVVTAAAWGGVHGTAPLFVDSTPPVTTASNTQAGSGSGWVDHSVAVTLTATDNGPGVSTTYYLLDGATIPIIFTGAPIAVSGDGVHTLTFWSVDAAGNEETPHHVRYVNIDTTAPAITSSADGDASWHGQPVTVTLSASDSGGSQVAEVQYRLHGTSTWIDAGAGQFTVAAPGDGSNDGSHLYDYQAVDGAGNVTQGSCTVNIDTTPPITNVDVTRDPTTGDVSVAFLPVDLNAGMTGGLAKTEYSIDGGPWVTGAQVELQPLVDHSTDGPHTVLYRSTDALGHVEPARSLTVTISAATTPIAPQTTVLGLTGLWRSTTAHLTFQSYEDPAGPGIAHTEYSLDNGAWETGTSCEVEAPADHSNDGPHLVCYRSVDKAGTVEQTHIVVVGIDTQKPVAAVQHVRLGWANKPFTLAFGALDPAPQSGIAHIEWSTTGGSWVSTGDSLTVAARGVTRVLYRAVDDAGNVGDTQVTYVRIDTSRPWTRAMRSTGLRHRRVSLRFRIYDGKPTCGKARVTLIVIKNAHGKVVARLRKAGLRKVNARSVYKVRLKLAKGRYRFTVRVTDVAGNKQTRAIAGTLVIR